jgi:hypothetical protein
MQYSLYSKTCFDQRSPPLAAVTNDEDCVELERVTQCRQLLLEAGADPLIYVDDHGETFNPFQYVMSGISVS